MNNTVYNIIEITNCKYVKSLLKFKKPYFSTLCI